MTAEEDVGGAVLSDGDYHADSVNAAYSSQNCVSETVK